MNVIVIFRISLNESGQTVANVGATYYLSLNKKTGAEAPVSVSESPLIKIGHSYGDVP